MLSNGAKINLKNLRDYESVKRENALPFAKNEITVFYYRSDLISDEQKEKIVNFFFRRICLFSQFLDPVFRFF